MRQVPFAALALLACIRPALSQQAPASKEGMGTVVGHVVCQDTGKPARFAQAILMAIPKAVTKPIDPAFAAKNPEAALVKGLSALGEVNLVSAETGLDGGYTAPNVAPGDYYVFAAVPGYVQPANLVRSLLSTDGADPAKPLPGVPVVHVTADRTANADISATRGAAIAGTIAWDDGSPITRATVEVLPSTGEQDKLPPQFGMLNMFSLLGGGLGLISDDLGHYRVSGLAPGTYILKVSLQHGTHLGLGASSTPFSALGANTPLLVYAPAALHRSGAKVFTLHAGEDRSDAEVTFDLTGMHSVSGRVEAVTDHHGINAGRVVLEDTTDKAFLRSAGLDAQGNFLVDFVPSGTYTLTVSGAEDTKPSEKRGKGILANQPETVRSYADSTPVAVTVLESNINGQTVSLTVEDPATVKNKEAELERLLKQ